MLKTGVNNMNKKILTLILTGWLLTTSIASVNAIDTHIEYINADIYVDDDFDHTTPGWQITHFDNLYCFDNL